MAASADELRRDFLLDPEVAFLNHGSFGSCPRPVFDSYRRWQRELEREPVDFILRRLPDLLAHSRAELARHVGAPSADLAFVTNATTGVNLAARALDLRPGDEVLATDLEYGACDLAWEWLCRRTGARYVRAPIPLPLDGAGTVADDLLAAVTDRTRVVYVSHVTSDTALVLPVEQIVRRARQLGLTTIVDGAHAPAHVPLDVEELGADFYSGNCHKWLMAPRGAGFLHVRPEWQERVDAPIVSWGYEPGHAFSERIELQGTRDCAAWLAVPDAIRYQEERDWDEVRARCHGLACETRRALCEVLGTEPLAPENMLGQMATVELPEPAPGLSERLFRKHRVEVPTMRPGDSRLRASIAAYTTEADVERLLAALPGELDPEEREQHEQPDPE